MGKDNGVLEANHLSLTLLKLAKRKEREREYLQGKTSAERQQIMFLLRHCLCIIFMYKHFISLKIKILVQVFSHFASKMCHTEAKIP